MSGLAVLAVTALVTVAGPGALRAQAVDACSGHKVRALSFSAGSVNVYKRSGFVCAVAVAKQPGVRRMMSVSVQARGSRPVLDRGRFTHHAGPVTVYAGHRCVWVKGTIGSSSVSSGWIMC
ncbi:hypothetical protein ACWCP6_14925 [Streptomyces sp. NPDC002004]